MRVLAIESTFDETAAAIVADRGNGVEVLVNVTASSAEIQAKYGGVVPEEAAREQVAAIIPVIAEALQKPLPTLPLRKGEERKGPQIDAVAVAYGPGLVGSLLIGVETIKTLALVWNKPLIKVNHMAAHVFANWILPSTASDIVTQRHCLPELPAIGLVVSGGHTDIILINSFMDWRWLGGTRDDAAGEVFDKAARAMGLPYPGGAEIAKLAESAASWQLTAGSFKLPRPMIHEDNLDLSFSGLKTALIRLTADSGQLADKKFKVALAREFNEAVVEVLVAKTMKAVDRYRPRSVLLAGGVAANQLLRSNLADSCQLAAVKLYLPELKYCTDNAAMIGAAAIMRPDYIDPLELVPEPGLTVV